MEKSKPTNPVQEAVRITVEREKQIWAALNQIVADAVATNNQKEEKTK